MKVYIEQNSKFILNIASISGNARNKLFWNVKYTNMTFEFEMRSMRQLRLHKENQQ